LRNENDNLILSSKFLDMDALEDMDALQENLLSASLSAV